MSPELRPPLVAIPSVRDTAHTFAAHGSSVMCPLSEVSVWLSQTAQRTCDLTFRVFPLRGIAPSRLHAGSSAFLALLLLITCPSPSSRQLILGITPGLGFLRNPSPYAMRLAPAPLVSRRGQTRLLRSQFPWCASVGRCSPPGLSAVQTGQCLSLSRLNVKCRQNLEIRYYGANAVTSCFLECQKPGELKSR